MQFHKISKDRGRGARQSFFSSKAFEQGENGEKMGFVKKCLFF